MEIHGHLNKYSIIFQSIIEEEFTKSEIKLINENINGTVDVLNDLLPDTTYMVGVLVITDDGNFNDQDILYGQYKTSYCKRKYFRSVFQLKSFKKSLLYIHAIL